MIGEILLLKIWNNLNRGLKNWKGIAIRDTRRKGVLDYDLKNQVNRNILTISFLPFYFQTNTCQNFH